MRARLRLWPVVWLVLVLATPLALLAVGKHQGNLENAVEPSAPKIDATSLHRASTYKGLDSWILASLPLRGRALDTYGKIELDLFHESTNPSVSIGQHGWLYFQPEVATCFDDGTPTVDPGFAADALDILARTLVASGRRTTVVVAGSKWFTHAGDAPHIPPAQAACARTLNDVIQQRLRTTPGGLDLAPQLDALEAKGEPVFLQNDSHWNWRGRQVFAQDVLSRIWPGFAKGGAIVPGPATHVEGDLSRLLGIDRADDDRALVARRPDAAAPKPGSVVLVGDSQLERSLLDRTNAPGVPPLRDALIPGTVSCNWDQLNSGACDAAIDAAKTVVIESVARDIHDTALYFCWRPVALAGEPLHGAPGAWRGVTGATRTLVIPRSGSVQVTIRPPDGDVSKVPRLERIPIVALPKAQPGGALPAIALGQAPLDGLPAPCAMPAQSVVGSGLFLPIPANRSAKDLVLTLAGPPGARIGAPETIVLDGKPVTDRAGG